MSKLFERILGNYAVKRKAHAYLTKILPPRTSMSTSSSINVTSSIDASARMVWLDMELTGLDLEKDTIMEIACVITEGNLSFVAQAPTFIIHQPKEVLDQMGPWCQQQHAKTGLIDECLKSSTTVQEADEQLYNFVKKYVPEGKGCVAGNSVYMDKWFVIKYLPKLNSHLHYRLIDVSTLKELCRKWRTEDFKKIPEKAYTHRALDDIMESIDELKHYKKILFDE
ncbi:probable oligoribonuclease isoform X2 [Planococcus citri]|uniref:probable oligoribonuclease isoform X2 n=1 Tax=Planococcus citri TaxID=170843 RepID=UPI0031F8C6A4